MLLCCDHVLFYSFKSFRYTALKTPPVFISTLCWRNSIQQFKARHLDGKTEFLVNQAYPPNSSQRRHRRPFPPIVIIIWQSCNIIVTDQRPLKSKLLFSAGRCVSPCQSCEGNDAEKTPSSLPLLPRLILLKTCHLCSLRVCS